MCACVWLGVSLCLCVVFVWYACVGVRKPRVFMWCTALGVRYVGVYTIVCVCVCVCDYVSLTCVCLLRWCLSLCMCVCVCEKEICVILFWNVFVWVWMCLCVNVNVVLSPCVHICWTQDREADRVRNTEIFIRDVTDRPLQTWPTHFLLGVFEWRILHLESHLDCNAQLLWKINPHTGRIWSNCNQKPQLAIFLD